MSQFSVSCFCGAKQSATEPYQVTAFVIEHKRKHAITETPGEEARRKLALENRAWLHRQQSDVQAAFAFIVAEGLTDEIRYPFKTIENGTGFPRERVRRICRHLARRGLLAYDKALWSESTGEPAGAGYGLTQTGIDLAELLHSNSSG